MDAAVGQLVASGLATSATLLCASLLRAAAKCARLFKDTPLVEMHARSGLSSMHPGGLRPCQRSLLL